MNREQVDTAPSEMLAALPEETRIRLRGELEDLTKCLGERWIGGPWDPKDDPERCHTQANLDKVAEMRVQDLTRLLADSPKGVKGGRIYQLLFLWKECWDLWNDYLIYRTLGAVTKAIEELQADSGHSSEDDSTDDRECAAWRAAGNAIRLLSFDAAIFRQIVLSDPSELSVQADWGVEASAELIAEVRSVLQRLDEAGEGGSLVARGLRHVEQVTVANKFLYGFLAAAAKALSSFHSWLGMLSQPDDTQRSENNTGREDIPALQSEDLLRSIDAALEDFRSVRRLDRTILSRAEPWEQLLREVREVVVQGSSAEIDDRVFVPRRVSVRYCYPFAIQTDEERAGKDEHSWRDRQLHGHDLDALGKELEVQLTEGLGIAVRDVQPFNPTAVFAARDSDAGGYGGVQVGLSDVMLTTGSGNQHAVRCKVWIVLSRMGNHCLCIEREAIESPLPQIVYRALAAGTPSVLGVTITLVGDTDGVVAWDNLYSFSQDVIRAVASAGAGDSKPYRHLRGNLQEVVIVQTEAPLAKEPDGIAAALNSRLGGRTLLKSIQLTASTTDEWIRYPPVAQTHADVISRINALQELGLAGDWCAHTGETTVFGITAAPSWHTDAYVEAAQFASSWSPLIRMWNRRLQEVIESASIEEETEAQTRELFQIERTVRRRLAQIRSEDLCSTFAHRRFLDQLLEMSGVLRLQAEMESLLEATERLMAWRSEEARRRADKDWRERDDQRHDIEEQQRDSNDTREKLLGVIALFGMFEFGAFLELANATKWHQSIFGLFTIAQGVWEDWFMVILFATALTVGLRLHFFGNFSLQRRLFIRSLRSRQPVRLRRSPNSL